MKKYDIFAHKDKVIHGIEVVTKSEGSLCYDREFMTADEFDNSPIPVQANVINVYHSVDITINEWVLVEQISTQHSIETMQSYEFNGKLAPIRESRYNKLNDSIEIFLDYCISREDDKEEMVKVDRVIKEYKEMTESNTGWLSKLLNSLSIN